MIAELGHYALVLALAIALIFGGSPRRAPIASRIVVSAFSHSTSVGNRLPAHLQ